jgi:hypothetical protein
MRDAPLPQHAIKTTIEFSAAACPDGAGRRIDRQNIKKGTRGANSSLVQKKHEICSFPGQVVDPSDH